MKIEEGAEKKEMHMERGKEDKGSEEVTKKSEGSASAAVEENTGVKEDVAGLGMNENNKETARGAEGAQKKDSGAGVTEKETDDDLGSEKATNDLEDGGGAREGNYATGRQQQREGKDESETKSV